MRGVCPILYVPYRSAAGFDLYFVSRRPKRLRALNIPWLWNAHSFRLWEALQLSPVFAFLICSACWGLRTGICSVRAHLVDRNGMVEGWASTSDLKTGQSAAGTCRAYFPASCRPTDKPSPAEKFAQMTARRRHTDEGRTYGAVVRSLSVWPELPPSAQTTCSPYRNLRSICRWKTRSTERTEKAWINSSLE